MTPQSDSTPSADHYHEKEGGVDHGCDDLFQSDSDRLPIQVAAPIVIALNLSLWLGIGLVVRALL